MLRILGYVFLSTLGFMLFFGMITGMLQGIGFSIDNLNNYARVLAAFLGLVVVALWGVRSGRVTKNEFKFSINLKSIPLLFVTVLFLDFILVIVGVFLPLPDFFVNLNGVDNSLLFLFLAVFVAPITEEIIFRGMITKLLMEKYPLPKALLFSSLIFGLVHANPAQLLTGLLLGFLLSWTYYKTRNLVLCILIHFFNNSIAVLLTLNVSPELVKRNVLVVVCVLITSVALLPLLFRMLQNPKYGFAQSIPLEK